MKGEITLALLLVSPKFQRGAQYYTAAVLALGFYGLIYFREAPVEIGPQIGVPEVHAGETVVIEAPARRDLSKDCVLRVSRDLVDSAQERRVLVAGQEIDMAGFAARENASPGRMRLKIYVPQNTPPGVAHVLTNARWSCTLNPTTYQWAYPIRTTFDWLIYVKPVRLTAPLDTTEGEQK